jgi:hypothetical protein
MLEAASALLAQGWSPTRSIIFAFGHDEEVGGKLGAGAAVGGGGGGGGGGGRGRFLAQVSWPASSLPGRRTAAEPKTAPCQRHCPPPPPPPRSLPHSAAPPPRPPGEAAKILEARGVQVEVIWDEGSSIMVDGVKPFMRWGARGVEGAGALSLWGGRRPSAAHRRGAPGPLPAPYASPPPVRPAACPSRWWAPPRRATRASRWGRGGGVRVGAWGRRQGWEGQGGGASCVPGRSQRPRRRAWLPVVGLAPPLPNPTPSPAPRPATQIHIDSPGGHASMPPIDGSGVADTMARVLARLAASPPRPRLTPPVVDLLRGLAPYAPGGQGGGEGGACGGCL